MTQALLDKSAKENRIRFSDGEDKCKVLRVGKIPQQLDVIKIGDITLAEKNRSEGIGPPLLQGQQQQDTPKSKKQ